MNLQTLEMEVDRLATERQGEVVLYALQIYDICCYNADHGRQCRYLSANKEANEFFCNKNSPTQKDIDAEIRLCEIIVLDPETFTPRKVLKLDARRLNLPMGDNCPGRIL